MWCLDVLRGYPPFCGRRWRPKFANKASPIVLNRATGVVLTVLGRRYSGGELSVKHKGPAKAGWDEKIILPYHSGKARKQSSMAAVRLAMGDFLPSASGAWGNPFCAAENFPQASGSACLRAIRRRFTLRHRRNSFLPLGKRPRCKGEFPFQRGCFLPGLWERTFPFYVENRADVFLIATSQE